MKKMRSISLTCTVLIFLCAAIVLVGVILAGQAATNVSFPALPTRTLTVTPGTLFTPSPTIQAAPPTTAYTPGAVVVTSPPADGGVTIQVEVTTTPTLLQAMQGAKLGTLDYSITLTAEAHVAGTEVSAYLRSVYATRTAEAEAVIPTHTALTALAATQGRK